MSNQEEADGVKNKQLENSFFFFLNQQFITQHVVVDRGSYFITMYMRGKLTGS